ncbi:MAG TPA: GyrI-like domain-containing protein [Gillisia sp.]|nr:GyrI-like domain-containing protein [Gillisia sp.]
MLLLLLAGVWYFGIKNYDYSISFRAYQVPGEVYQKILVYDYKDLQNITETDRTPYDRIDQTAIIGETDIDLNWHIMEENDSLSRVSVSVNQENRFLSRLQMLTGTNKIQKILSKEVQRFKLALELDAEQYKVEITGTENSPAATCACISLENDIDRKAGDMMQNIGSLAAFFKENELEMAGKPRIQVKDWDKKANRINYEFCFPFVPGEVSSPVPEIYIKEFPSQNSIHAIYNGNYMYSHLAWLRIMDYAQKNDYELNNTPLEIFQENPELGGDSRFWRADIYIPIK